MNITENLEILKSLTSNEIDTRKRLQESAPRLGRNNEW